MTRESLDQQIEEELRAIRARTRQLMRLTVGQAVALCLVGVAVLLVSLRVAP